MFTLILIRILENCPTFLLLAKRISFVFSKLGFTLYKRRQVLRDFSSSSRKIKTRNGSRYDGLFHPTLPHYVHPCIFTGSNNSQCVIEKTSLNSYSCRICHASWSCSRFHQPGVSNGS